jgi:methionine aminopeptidase
MKFNGTFAQDFQSLIDGKIVEEYPPIYDIEGSYVAQTEHNVWIGEKRAYPLTL